MALKVHHLRPAPGARTEAKRVGRGEGGKGGKTAGRGTKGSGARKNVPESFEEMNTPSTSSPAWAARSKNSSNVC